MGDTVTLSRAEYDAMLARLRAFDALLEDIEDAEDIAIANERRNDERIPAEMVSRMIRGESPVAVWCEHRGLTQDALAEQANLSPTVLDEIVQGKHTPSLPEARAIATALKLGLDDLFLEVPAARL